MQKLKKLGLQAVLLSVTLLFVAVIPAHAIQDANSSDTSSDQTAKTESTTSDTAAKKNMYNAELRKKAEAELAAKRQKHEGAKSKEERHKRCESHKQGLTTKFSRISANSQKIKDHIDSVFTKAQAYQQAKNLHPDNYDALVATATNAQAAAATSITTLKNLTPTIDCNNESTASDVAAFKMAAADARDKLKAYRTAVKDVLKALQSARKSTTEGSNQ
ncbi:MAG: hypothetical protein AAB971_02340 [Patescibacteria group bacterium]